MIHMKIQENLPSQIYEANSCFVHLCSGNCILGLRTTLAGSGPPGGVMHRSQTASAEINHREVFRRLFQLADRSIDHPGANVEEWLRELYPMRNDPLQEMVQGTTWSKALRFALACLIDLPRGRNSHYYFGICTAKCHPIHQRFWRRIIACTGGLELADLSQLGPSELVKCFGIS